MDILLQAFSVLIIIIIFIIIIIIIIIIFSRWISSRKHFQCLCLQWWFSQCLAMVWSSWPTAGDDDIIMMTMMMTGMAMMMTIMMTKSYDRKINSIPGRVWEELHQTGFLHFEECVLFIREPVRCWIHPFPSSIIRIWTKGKLGQPSLYHPHQGFSLSCFWCEKVKIFATISF